MRHVRRNPVFRPSPFGKQLEGRDLRGKNFSHMDLSGANFGGADLTGANLSGADLTGADLEGAYLDHASLIGAVLINADLGDADLTDAKLMGANLAGANLEHANLADANLKGANLAGANLTKSVLVGTKLTAVKGLDTSIGYHTARYNPFFVSPGGAAVKVSDADFAARKFPAGIEREVKIEGFDPNNLPPGFTVERDGNRYHVFFQGRDTGLYAMDPRKAAEIVSRKGGDVASGVAPKAAAGRPSGTPSDRALFGVGRDELVRRSRAGDKEAADELRLRGRDPMTGVKTEGLASRFSKAVVNGRMRR